MKEVFSDGKNDKKENSKNDGKTIEGRLSEEVTDYLREISPEDMEKYMLQESMAYGACEWEKGEKTYEDYLALPDDMRAELIDGVFYDMASPSAAHQDISAEIWLVFPVEQKVLVYLFGEQDQQILYSFENEIPVGIWNGECRVDFKEILKSADSLLDLEEEKN